MININKVKTYSVLKRKSKVEAVDFAKPPVAGRSFTGFCRALPNILKVKELIAVADAVVRARKQKKSVIFMAGAHVIKCGLSPVLIELIKKRVITCVCLNGAGIIHDFEIAFQGKTINAIRTLLMSVASRNGIRVSLEIIEEGKPKMEHAEV